MRKTQLNLRPGTTLVIEIRVLEDANGTATVDDEFVLARSSLSNQGRRRLSTARYMKAPEVDPITVLPRATGPAKGKRVNPAPMPRTMSNTPGYIPPSEFETALRGGKPSQYRKGRSVRSDCGNCFVINRAYLRRLAVRRGWKKVQDLADMAGVSAGNIASWGALTVEAPKHFITFSADSIRILAKAFKCSPAQLALPYKAEHFRCRHGISPGLKKLALKQRAARQAKRHVPPTPEAGVVHDAQ